MNQLNIPQNTSFVRMVVPNRSFGQVLLPTEIRNSTETTSQVITTLHELFNDVKIQRGQPIGFDSIKEFVGLDYVGYVIEKERLNRKNNQWTRIDEYRIIGVESESFIDTRVAYGEIYRYRIKNIIRVTKREKIREKVDSTNFADLNQTVKERLAQEVEKKIELFFNTNVFTNLGLSSKNLTKGIEITLFDNYIAKFDGTKVEITQKGVDANIDQRLLKNSLVTNISVLGKNYNVFLPLINQDVFIEKMVYKSYYYESLSSKQWKYIEVYENVPPPPPESIKIFPNTLGNKIIINWLRPSNSQRDIKSYRVYRRNALGQVWTLIKEINELDINSDGIPDVKVTAGNSANLFIDTNVNTANKYIYALTCVDIHDIESFLSVQIQCELNPAFKDEKQERPLKWISGSGARLDELNFVYKKFLNRTEQIIAKRNVRITPASNFSESQKTFLIRITSLDTHLKKEYKIKLVNERV